MTTLFTTGELAQKLGARLVGPADLPLSGLATLDDARPGHLTFVRDKHYAQQWASSKASAAIAAESAGLPTPAQDPPRALLLVKDADHALIALLDSLARTLTAVKPAPGVHPTAVIDPAATIAPSATVGPFCIVGAHASVGEGSWLVSGVTLGAHASIGRGSTLHPGVVVYDRCVIGNACIVHANAVIGADGFGYRPAPKELLAQTGGILKVPHVGNAVIHDLVEIGAGSCIDRAKFGSTVIGAATKIDNLVQVGHGCKIGRACLICGQSGLGGSAVLEDGVTLAGQVGVRDGIRVGAGALIMAQAGVMEDVPPNAKLWGIPAESFRDVVRKQAAVRKLVRTENNPGG